MGEIVRVDGPHLPAPPSRVDELVRMFLSGRSPRTLDAYARSLDDFAAHVGRGTTAATLEWLLMLDHGQANAAAIGWRNAMVTSRKAPATVALRLAALRSIVRLARTIGMVPWTLEVTAPKVRTLKDTAGPGAEGWRAMLDAAKASDGDPRGARDLALIRLMHDTALRVSEAIGLDLADVDLARPSITIVGKGQTEPTRLTIPPQVRDALAAWIGVRGKRPGPLFHRLDRAANPASPGRLTTRAVRMVVGELADRSEIGRHTSPHMLRHAGITQALDATNGDVRSVMRFSRHAKLETLIRYDDNRRDDFGRIAGIVSED